MKFPRRTRPAAGDSIVPLIDVVFFLLVFFMLVGRMDATAPFEVAPPVSRAGADLPGGGVTVSLSAAGEVALDGETLPRAALAAALAAREEPPRLIRINADRGARSGDLLALVAVLEILSGVEIVLVVTPEAG